MSALCRNSLQPLSLITKAQKGLQLFHPVRYGSIEHVKHQIQLTVGRNVDLGPFNLQSERSLNKSGMHTVLKYCFVGC